jgi:hypothetical protein
MTTTRTTATLVGVVSRELIAPLRLTVKGFRNPETTAATVAGFANVRQPAAGPAPA